MVQLVIDDLAVEVSMKKLNPAELFPKPKPYKKVPISEVNPDQPSDEVPWRKLDENEAAIPLMRQRTYLRRDTGERLGTVAEITYKDEFVDDKGIVVPMEEILWLIETDGQLQKVKPYSRTKIIQGVFDISRAAVESWVPESAYEIYINKSKYNEAERRRMEGRLFQKAEEWYNADKAKIGQWIFREGAQPYVMIVFPYIKKISDNNFQFCFVTFFTRTKNEYKNLMEVTPLMAKVEIVEEPNNEQLLKVIAQ